MAFDPANSLEAALVLAASDPEQRPQFYRELNLAEFFIYQDSDKPFTNGGGVLPPGTPLNIRKVETRGLEFLPVFSSIQRLQTVTQGKPNYLVVNAVEFFRMTRGANVVLNPGSDYGKEFLAEEIAALLDNRVLVGPALISIGQPAREPQALLKALTEYFSGIKQVKRASLAHYHDTSKTLPPHTLIGLELDGDWEEIVSGAAKAIKDVEVFDPPVEFIKLGEGGKVDAYFEDACKPFYRRKRFGLF